MRLPVNLSLYSSALALLASGAAAEPDQTAAPTGPAADYPVVVGDAFRIGETVWTPTDQLNYDAVGHAVTGDAGLGGVTAAHKTLPLPSYAEVTSLDTGKTILVRVTRRGPMSNNDLIELSPMASMQLGVSAGVRAAVRVRRVNPPEQERAMLRSGGRAPERMETPDGLLRVLRRKLAEQSPTAAAPTPPSTPPSKPAAPTVALKNPGEKGEPKTSAQPPAQPVPPATPNSSATPPVTAPGAEPEKTAAGLPTNGATSGKSKAKPPENAQAQTPAKTLEVQVAAFTVEANARKAANGLGASVSKAGRLWHVRLGPYANRAQAAAALEKAKRSGYSDARIQSAD
jgi:Lipoproteins